MHTGLIRSIMKEHRTVTHNFLAGESGLSPATCKNIMNALLSTGEVYETVPAPSTGGRPSKQFSYNPNFAHAMLIYLRKEGDRQILFFRIVNALGARLSDETREFESLGLEEFTQAIDSVLISHPHIRIIALGVPGIIHKGVIKTCDIPSFPAIDIVEYLSSRYSLPVTAENDVNITALGHHLDGQKESDESFAYLYYPEAGGMGAGIVIHGQLITGSSDFAGELSYLPELGGVDQSEVQKDENAFASLVSHMILSLNCVINPQRIVIAGTFFTASLTQKILSLLQISNQREQLPDIEFVEDIHESFISGLNHMAMQTLTYTVKR